MSEMTFGSEKPVSILQAAGNNPNIVTNTSNGDEFGTSKTETKLKKWPGNDEEAQHTPYLFRVHW